MSYQARESSINLPVCCLEDARVSLDQESKTISWYSEDEFLADADEDDVQLNSEERKDSESVERSREIKAAHAFLRRHKVVIDKPPVNLFNNSKIENADLQLFGKNSLLNQNKRSQQNII